MWMDLQKNGEISAGGLIQNDKAEWIVGFPKSIGVGSSLLAEAWALLSGI